MTPNVAKLAAAQFAAGVIGRAFAAATIEGEAGSLLTPFIRELVGRELVLRGEALLVPGEGANLLPASSFEVFGGADPASWRYRADLTAPGGTVYQDLPADGVLHPRVNVAPSRPWAGRSAFSLASATAATAASAEATAAAEARVAVSRLIPDARPMTADQRKQAEGDLATEVAKGGYFAVPLVGNRPGMGERMNRVSVEPVHPDPAQGHLELRRGAALDLLNAAGVPATLADPRAEAQGQREAFRRLVHGTVEPLARAVEAEFAAKLAMPVRFDFGALFAADLAGRGRALKQMVDSGVSLDAALETVGLGG